VTDGLGQGGRRRIGGGKTLQLGGLLRARYCDPKIRGLNKTDGLTWKVKEILERAKTNVAAGLRKL